MPDSGGNPWEAVKIASDVAPWNWDKFTAAWVVWIVWFVVWEAYALIDGGEETFSHHIWWLRNNGPSIVFFLILGIVLWLVYHFTVEGR